MGHDKERMLHVGVSFCSVFSCLRIEYVCAHNRPYFDYIRKTRNYLIVFFLSFLPCDKHKKYTSKYTSRKSTLLVKSDLSPD